MGYTDVGSIATWAGFAFGITELFLAVTIPLWGIVADRYGRKPMLIRASLGIDWNGYVCWVARSGSLFDGDHFRL